MYDINFLKTFEHILNLNFKFIFEITLSTNMKNDYLKNRCVISYIITASGFLQEYY